MQNNLKITLEMKLNSIITLFLCVFLSSNALSQHAETKYPSVSVINSDTVIIFTFLQAQKLAIINEDKKRLEKLNVINEKQLQDKDSIINFQKDELENYDKIKRKYEAIIIEKDNLKKLSDSQNIVLIKEIRKQVKQKWIAIISGIAGFATVSYLYITK